MSTNKPDLGEFVWVWIGKMQHAAFLVKTPLVAVIYGQRYRQVEWNSNGYREIVPEIDIEKEEVVVVADGLRKSGRLRTLKQNAVAKQHDGCIASKGEPTEKAPAVRPHITRVKKEAKAKSRLHSKRPATRTHVKNKRFRPTLVGDYIALNDIRYAIVVRENIVCGKGGKMLQRRLQIFWPDTLKTEEVAEDDIVMQAPLYAGTVVHDEEPPAACADESSNGDDEDEDDIVSLDDSDGVYV